MEITETMASKSKASYVFLQGNMTYIPMKWLAVWSHYYDNNELFVQRKIIDSGNLGIFWQ